MDASELKAELERHHPGSYGWALSCCAGCEDLADDVLQIAYLRILEGRARFGQQSGFRTWLFGVIRLTALEERRRHWLRSLRLSRLAREPFPEGSPADAGQERDREAGTKLFRNALDRLPRRQREVLHLVFYQDLTLQEASVVMKVSLGSARKHYDRAKAALRRRLAKTEFSHEYAIDRPGSQAALL